MSHKKTNLSSAYQYRYKERRERFQGSPMHHKSLKNINVVSAFFAVWESKV